MILSDISACIQCADAFRLFCYQVSIHLSVLKSKIWNDDLAQDPTLRKNRREKA